MSECKCEIARFGDALREEVTDEILFCPMHKAAPELLAACKGALAHLVSGDLTLDMALNRLRTAIAKAGGEQS